MIATLPPPLDRRIELVGFTSPTNGRSCPIHECCGLDLVQDRRDQAEGQIFRLRLVEPEVLEEGTSLALYQIKSNGEDGCRVGFARRIYAVTRGQELNGRLVRLLEVYHPDHENSSKRAC